ncbi:MAG: biotin transporter BioY [Clostridiales Family XIII bacterium]|jgi:biotin transport system substrate-specific component|nr:biotin transporter BioY [Clostridiales Family XIII bacterium]
MKDSKTANKFNTKDLTLIALFAAFTVVMAQLAIPLPGGVPITLQTFAVLLAGIVLGSKRGAIAILIYLLLGAIGLPVFANFHGGIGELFGSTGGFLLTFPIMALIVGLASNTKNVFLIAIAMVVASLVNFIAGTAMFMIMTNINLTLSLSYCVIPFIPGTIIKCVAAGVIGFALKKRGLVKA